MSNTSPAPIQKTAPEGRAPRAGIVTVLKDVALLAKDAGVRWVDDSCYRLGASLAYYALFSIFPLLLLSVTAIGFVLGNDQSVRDRVVGSISSATSPEIRTLLDQTLQSMQEHRTARGIGALVGVVTLFLGASGVFSELETSLDTVWRVKSASSSGILSTVLQAVKDKAFSFVVVLAGAAALLASLIVGTALHAIGAHIRLSAGELAIWWVIEMVVSLGFLTLLLAAVYRIVPQTHVEWRDVFGGALVGALLFTGLKALFAWYLANLGSYAAYGAVGGVLGLLTWIYTASLVLFYGAEFSRVYAERYGSVARAARDATPDGPDAPDAASAHEGGHGDGESLEKTKPEGKATRRSFA